MSVSEQSIQIVKSTVSALRSHGVEITSRMYDLLFQAHPELSQLFPDKEAQSKRLASAILAYAANIDNLDVLQDAVEKIARTHVGSQVRPEHYPAVATALIAAMKDVLGEEVINPAVVEAWSEAYFFLADILQKKESELYLQQMPNEGNTSVAAAGHPD